MTLLTLLCQGPKNIYKCADSGEFLAGDAAYWIIRCPAETIKTRVQTGVDDNMFQSVFKIIKTEGWYGFYRGYI